MNRIVTLSAVFVSALAFGSVGCAPVEDEGTEGSSAAASEITIAAPPPKPVVLTCITNGGRYEVTEEQCKKLLTIAGCKPGAVVGDKMKCSTASTDPAAPTEGADDLANAPPREPEESIDDLASGPPSDPVLVTCITNGGRYEVTEEQCKKLLTIAGCKPGAVVGDKMKCSTAG